MIFLTGLGNLLAMIPALSFFKKDQKRYGNRYLSRQIGGFEKKGDRFRLTMQDFVLLLLIGSGLALYCNVLLGWLQMLGLLPGVDPLGAYMEGYSFPMLILILGIFSPITEEMVFRWLLYYRLRDYLGKMPAVLLSALVFGIYHLNILQGVYAFILGTAFALFQEWSGNLWTSVLLHIGANCFSLLISEFGTVFFGMDNEYLVLLVYFVLMFAIVGGTNVFRRRSRSIE